MTIDTKKTTEELKAELADILADMGEKKSKIDVIGKEWEDILVKTVKGVIEVSDKDYEIKVGSDGDSIIFDVYSEDAKEGDSWRNSRRLDLRIREVRGEHYRPTGKFEVTVNWGCFGEVAPTNKYGMNYAVMIGNITKNLAELTNFVNESEVFKNLNELTNEYGSLRWAKETYESVISSNEREDKAKVVREELKVGVKINTNARSKNVRPWFIKTIDKVMPKNITFQEDIGRTKIDEAVDAILRGAWEIVK